ncbi:MAG: hypothetical protein U9Q39_00840 [Pseudomonadota bacterium]|nr:hypothetical protein [Pseudomonadota bacterium]
MARKLLSLCRFGEEYHALKVERQGDALVPVGSLLEVTPESLPELCRWADEIYFGGSFPTALYVWEELPKVGKKYLPALVEKSVKAKVGSGVTLATKFYSGVPVETSDRDRTPVLAIPLQELQPVWQELLPFKEKIKRIAPLPSGLARLAASLTKASSSFIVAWVSQRTTEIVVASPEGLVKIARSVPIGLAEGGDLDGFAIERFIVDIGREITTTQTFFKQEFRQAAPSELLLLAGPAVIRGLERFPLNVVGLNVKIPESSPFGGLEPAQVGPLAHLLALFDVAEEFNFLPPDLVSGRRSKRLYKLAYVALMAAFIGSAAWLYLLEMEKRQLLQSYSNNLETYEETRLEVMALQRDVKSLRPLKGWETYYNEVYRQRPRWNSLISELALKVDAEIWLDDFLIQPDKKNRSKGAWLSSLSGNVRAVDWQSGLDKLRVFGGELEGSSGFVVRKLNYIPKKLSAPGARIFSFKMELEVKTEAELEPHEI